MRPSASLTGCWYQYMTDPWSDNPIQPSQPDYTSSLLIVARTWSGFIGFLYIFGQAFVSLFNVLDTLAGISGMMLALLATKKSIHKKPRNRLIVICGVIVTIGVLYGTYDYYDRFQSPGNYYSWTAHYSYLFAVLLIVFSRKFKKNI